MADANKMKSLIKGMVPTAAPVNDDDVQVTDEEITKKKKKKPEDENLDVEIAVPMG